MYDEDKTRKRKKGTIKEVETEREMKAQITMDICIKSKEGNSGGTEAGVEFNENRAGKKRSDCS